MHDTDRQATAAAENYNTENAEVRITAIMLPHPRKLRLGMSHSDILL